MRHAHHGTAVVALPKTEVINALGERAQHVTLVDADLEQQTSQRVTACVVPYWIHYCVDCLLVTDLTHYSIDG